MKEKVLQELDDLHIDYELILHDPFYTVDDLVSSGIKFPGLGCKNLFLRNEKKTSYYLVILPDDKAVSIKHIQEILNEKRFSFTSGDDLLLKLGVNTGSVSLFNIINIKSTDIKVIIDEEILSSNKVCFHPNDNSATVIINTSDIEFLLKHYKIDYEYLNI